MKPLFELDAEFRELQSQIEAYAALNEGEIPDELDAQLDSVGVDRQRKISNIALYVKNLKAEADMKVECLHEKGLLISTASEMGTVAHLIYELANLAKLIREYEPGWLEELLFVSIPMPNHILVARHDYYEMVRGIGDFFLQRYGRILSPYVYVLAKGRFIGKVSFKVGDRKLIVLPLEDELLEPARN